LVLLKGAAVFGDGLVVDVLTLVCEASKVSTFHDALNSPGLTLLRPRIMMSVLVL
jgi:hypothetical protein